MSEGAGKGDKRCPYDQKAWDVGYDRAFGLVRMTGQIVENGSFVSEGKTYMLLSRTLEPIVRQDLVGKKVEINGQVRAEDIIVVFRHYII
jgi:hypothetical protein